MIDKPIMLIQKILKLEASGLNKKYNDFAVIIFGCLVIWVLGRFTFGVAVANKEEYCRMKSIGDFLIAPAYTVGCNIGKDRWDIRVN